MEDTLGDLFNPEWIDNHPNVLILVLMEDTLGGIQMFVMSFLLVRVLILVLMEDTLGVLFQRMSTLQKNKVLILVLMEDTLGERVANPELKRLGRLNPCFNGRYSRSPDPKNPKITASLS